MTSVGSTADLILSADDQTALISEKLDHVLRESVDISSFTLADPRLVSDLKVHLCFIHTINILNLKVKYANIIIKPLLRYPGDGRQTAVCNEKDIRTRHRRGKTRAGRHIPFTPLPGSPQQCPSSPAAQTAAGEG